MSDVQAGAPDKDNAQAAGDPGQDSSLLTGAKAQAADGAAPLADGATSDAPKWMAQLPEDLKASKSLTKFQTIGDLGKSYVELEGKLGKAVVLPGEKATDEERAAYRKAMGVPDKPTEYPLKKVTIPNDPFGPKLAEDFLTTACAAGMTPPQAQAAYDYFALRMVRALNQGIKSYQTTVQEAERTLRKELGDGVFEESIPLAQRALTDMWDPETIKAIDRSGLGNHTGFIKGLMKMGKRGAEHKFVDGKPAGGGPKSLADQMYGTVDVPQVVPQ